MRMTQLRPHTRSDRRPSTPRPSRGPGTWHTAAPRLGTVSGVGAARRIGEPSPTPPTSPAVARRRGGARTRLLLIAELAVVVLLVSGPAAHAQTTEVVALAGSVNQVLDNIRAWIVGILASLATAFLTIGGVRYLLGGGDPGEIEKAKTSFKAAGIGYCLAILAPVVLSVLENFVGA